MCDDVTRKLAFGDRGADGKDWPAGNQEAGSKAGCSHEWPPHSASQFYQQSIAWMLKRLARLGLQNGQEITNVKIAL